MYSKNAGHPKLPVSNSKGSERTQKHPPWTAAKAAIEPPRRADLSSPSRPQISLTSPAPTRRTSSSREPTPTRRGCASPCRPLLVKPKEPGFWELINWSSCILTDLAILYFWGFKALALRDRRWDSVALSQSGG